MAMLLFVWNAVVRMRLNHTSLQAPARVHARDRFCAELRYLALNRHVVCQPCHCRYAGKSAAAKHELASTAQHYREKTGTATTHVPLAQIM